MDLMDKGILVFVSRLGRRLSSACEGLLDIWSPTSVSLLLNPGREPALTSAHLWVEPLGDPEFFSREIRGAATSPGLVETVTAVPTKVGRKRFACPTPP